MSWTPAPRHCVVIRDGKLYIEGDDRALVLPWYLRVNSGRLQYDRRGGGEKHTPHDIEWDYYRVGFPDEPNKFWVQRCGNCRGLFVGPGVASCCGPCADVARNEAAARAKERAKEASAERSVQRQAKRAEAKCAACGKPIVGRQRSSDDRPAYCSSACRQWTYRRRKQTVAEPQASSSGIPFMITVEMKRGLREIGRTEDEIFNMTPAEAHQLLNESVKPSAVAPCAVLEGEILPPRRTPAT